MDTALAVALVQAILANTPKAIALIAPLFQSGELPTPEQIRSLKITKDPEEYFTESSKIGG